MQNLTSLSLIGFSLKTRLDLLLERHLVLILLGLYFQIVLPVLIDEL
jgi:hypothetical protein